SNKVTLNHVEKNLQIKTDTGEYLILSDHFDEKPETIFREKNTFTLEGNILLEGISNTFFSASTDETKTVLCGINLQIQGKLNKFCATNAHHLSEIKIDSEISNPDRDLQISNKVCILLLKLLSPQDKVSISLGQESYVKPDSEEVVTYEVAILQFGENTLKYSLPYSGKFPEYESLIPTRFERKLIVERLALIEAIESTSAIAEQSKSSVKVVINQDNQEIKVSCECQDVGSSTVALPAQIAGGSYTYCFHLPYLLGGLKSLKSTEVCISLNAALSPAIIEPLSVQKRKFLIMPQQQKK
ncbi:MAG: DNA polymerase III subunit beta, partial [Sphaerospermopsis kisseleviana]